MKPPIVNMPDMPDTTCGTPLSDIIHHMPDSVPYKGRVRPVCHVGEKQRFTLEVEVSPGREGIRQLRAMLKRFGRDYSIQCKAIRPARENRT